MDFENHRRLITTRYTDAGELKNFCYKRRKLPQYLRQLEKVIRY